jgi:plastocyanin
MKFRSIYLMLALIVGLSVLLAASCGDDDDDDDDSSDDDDAVGDDDDAVDDDDDAGDDDDDDDDDDNDDDVGDDDDDTIPTVHLVSIKNFAMNPDPRNISLGDSVLWKNEDSVQHTVTSGDPGDPDEGSVFDSGLLSKDDTFEHTFNSAGTFNYFCQPHKGSMFGFQVIVSP